MSARERRLAGLALALFYAAGLACGWALAPRSRLIPLPVAYVTEAPHVPS